MMHVPSCASGRGSPVKCVHISRLWSPPLEARLQDMGASANCHLGSFSGAFGSPIQAYEPCRIIIVIIVLPLLLTLVLAVAKVVARAHA